jgi:hypothetical protein
MDQHRADEIRAALGHELDAVKLRRWVMELLDGYDESPGRIRHLRWQLNEVSARLPVPGAGTVNSQRGRLENSE